MRGTVKREAHDAAQAAKAKILAVATPRTP